MKALELVLRIVLSMGGFAIILAVLVAVHERFSTGNLKVIRTADLPLDILAWFLVIFFLTLGVFIVLAAWLLPRLGQ